ncbi:Uncharacterised protein [Mycobacterium tuberculosis]|nr:Uncharacterised protein [Mycobacterium tuberculosis]
MWPGLARERNPVQAISVSCGSAVGSTRPFTVKAGPQSFWPAISGRSVGGSVKSRRPAARITSWRMPV